MARVYHPSPNCPCEGCQKQYHGYVSHADNRDADVASLPRLPAPRKKKRLIRGPVWQEGPGRVVQPSPLVDLLDMPTADRAVLISIIQGKVDTI